MTDNQGEITHLLRVWSQGDKQALDEVLPLAFDDLRRIAAKCHHRLPTHQLQATELIGEIYESLHAQRKVSWQCRGQFYKFAGLLMERVLLSYRRSARAQKRGGDSVDVPLIEAIDHAVVSSATSLASEVAGMSESSPSSAQATLYLAQTIDIVEKIAELSELDRQQADIARLRYLVGLTIEETADVLGISTKAVSRGWRRAKTFLLLELQGYGQTQANPRETEIPVPSVADAG